MNTEQGDDCTVNSQIGTMSNSFFAKRIKFQYCGDLPSAASTGVFSFSP